MSRSHPNFKETQIFDWDAEPVLERSSSFFHGEELRARPVPLRRRSSGAGKLLLACALIVGAGVAGLMALIPLVHQHFK